MTIPQAILHYIEKLEQSEKFLAQKLYDSGADPCKFCVHDKECNNPETWEEDSEETPEREKCIAGMIAFARKCEEGDK